MVNERCFCVVKIIVAIGFMLSLYVLVGCSTIEQAKIQARSAGAQAYDDALDSAVMVICNDTSVGSIKRRFGVSTTAMQSWIDFCYGDQAQIMVPEQGVKDATRN